MTFYDYKQQYNWEQECAEFDTFTAQDVEHAIATATPTLRDFKALISPAGDAYLDAMATKAQQLSIERFGKTIRMYEPLYLSNYCHNHCVYCGFNQENDIVRKVLTMEEVQAEAKAIADMGFTHILLVAGESPKHAGVEYYRQVIEFIRPMFAQISIEVQPMSVEDYKVLVEAGAHYVCVYQETYNEESYPRFHPKGLKANYRFRLETPDRAAEAGFRKVGIGALLGLDNWRTDAFFTALHLDYLESHHWQTKYSISLPRLRPHVGSYMPADPINDRQMVQLICAYRIFDPEVEISLSTRESSAFRDMAVRIGANSMSAGSSTQPGGYVNPNPELEQFSINDSRSPEEMIAAIKAQGYEVIWKDWDQWM